jgi:8-oxo-dGTP pyrophosphatase MutT (NUDIX family)
MRERYVEAVREQLAGFVAGGDARAESSVARIRELLEGVEDPMSRKSFAPGHLTGSAILLSPDERCCALIWHRKLQRWLQPGGHVELGDAGPLGTAKREALEECRAAIDGGFAPVLIQVDVHEIPAHGEEPAHFHHDLVYLLRSGSERLWASDEVERAVWCPLDAPDEYEPDGALADSIERTRRWLAEHR